MQIKLNPEETVYVRNFTKIPNRLLVRICEPTEQEVRSYRLAKYILKREQLPCLSRKSIRLLLLLFMLKEDFQESTDEYEENRGENVYLNVRKIANLLCCEKREVIKAINELYAAELITYTTSARYTDEYAIAIATEWLIGSTTNYTEFDFDSMSQVLNLKNTTAQRIGKNEIKLYLRFMMDNSKNLSTTTVKKIKNSVCRHLNYRTKIQKFTDKLNSLFTIKYHDREISFKRMHSVRDKKHQYKIGTSQRIRLFMMDLFKDELTKQKSLQNTLDEVISKLSSISLITGMHILENAMHLTVQEYREVKSPLALLTQFSQLTSSIAYSLFLHNAR